MSDVLSAAVRYAERGWPVLPVGGDKRPLLKDWPRLASDDPRTVRDRWSGTPIVNVGIVTGRRSGLLVFDLDPRTGGDDAWHELEREHRPMATVEQHTPNGGRHLFFRRPDVPYLGNATGALPQGIDVRCDGGYIVAAPSRHSSGRAWQWDVERHPDDHPIVDAPAGLLALLLREKRRGRKASRHEGPIPEGRRNHTLTRLAGCMRRAGMGEPEIAAGLFETNRQRCMPPLPAAEVARIAASIGSKATGPLWVIDPHAFTSDPRLSSAQRLLLFVLATHADDEGWVRGGEWLPEKMAMGRNAVGRAARELCEMGRLEVRRKPLMANLYRLVDFEQDPLVAMPTAQQSGRYCTAQVQRAERQGR